MTRRNEKAREPLCAAIGIDAGGTFTDVVAADGRVAKLPSDHARSGQVLAEGLRSIRASGGALAEPLSLIHGSTVATNALLTGNLAPVGLLITRGFRDLIALGRQNRPDLYALAPARAFAPPRDDLIAEIDERIDARGRVRIPLDPDPVRSAGRALLRRGARVLCVCLLHSWRQPRHERQVAALLEELGLPVVLSSAVAPEFREFERFTTAWTAAQLHPVVGEWLRSLAAEGPALARAAGSRRHPRFTILMSDGGSAGIDEAGRAPERLLLSGPAGGVQGAWEGASTAARRRLITLDMGGTSTDVALLDGGLPVIHNVRIGGRPLLVPVVDIHTVGAGGGSIARRDAGHGLSVGPESAGANPGPACYGRGGPPTVTDANLVLGRLPDEGLLGGAFGLDRAAAERAIAALARSLGLDLLTCALGILRIAEATMQAALRRISLERGKDPRDFALVAFGGAGGLHAATLAAELGIRQVVIPRDPGLLSARGMLSARVLKTRSRTVLGMGLRTLRDQADLAFADLEREGLRAMRREGLDAAAVGIERFADLRFEGQGTELTVPLSPGLDIAAAFGEEHRRRFGFVLEDREVELVALRARFSGPVPRAPAPRPVAAGPIPEPFRRCRRPFVEGERLVSYHRREDLPAARPAAGPAVIVEYSATTLVPPGWTFAVEAESGALLLRAGDEA